MCEVLRVTFVFLSYPLMAGFDLCCVPKIISSLGNPYTIYIAHIFVFFFLSHLHNPSFYIPLSSIYSQPLLYTPNFLKLSLIFVFLFLFVFFSRICFFHVSSLLSQPHNYLYICWSCSMLVDLYFLLYYRLFYCMFR